MVYILKPPGGDELGALMASNLTVKGTEKKMIHFLCRSLLLGTLLKTFHLPPYCSSIERFIKSCD